MTEENKCLECNAENHSQGTVVMLIIDFLLKTLLFNQLNYLALQRENICS